MSTHAQPTRIHISPAGMNLPGSRKIALDQPRRWLVAGVRALRQAWHPRLPYGIVFALLGNGLVE